MHERNNGNKPGLLLIAMGTLLTSMTIVGFGLGFALDTLFGTAPLLMLLLGLFGMVGGMIRVYKMLVR